MSPTLPPPVRVLERCVRRTPFGLRARDLATGSMQVQGLLIRIFAAERPGPGIPALPTPSGTYVAHGLPGLAPFEHADGDAWPSLPDLPRTFRVEVQDPQGRFLPLRFETALPTFGPVDPFGIGSPLDLFASPLESPLAPAPLSLPLFSAPTRPLGDALALVRAELHEHPSGRPAPWTLLQIDIGGSIRGLGVSDGAGRVAVQFPYPPSLRAPPASPASPRDDFRWDIELRAHYRPPPADAPTPALADLAGLAVADPRPLLGSLAPPTPLGPLTLDYRVPLTVRTALGAGTESPYLYLDLT